MTQAIDSTRKSSTPEKRRVIEPLFYSAFPRIFGKEESKPVTLGLVNAILDRIGFERLDRIDIIDFEHTVLEGSVECKTPRMDIRLVAPGRVLDIEAQLYPEDMGTRMLVYASKLINESLPAGADYDDLPQTILITLLDAPAKFPDLEPYVHVARILYEEGELLSDRLTFVCELS